MPTLAPVDLAWLADLRFTLAQAVLVPLRPWSPTPDLGVTVRGAVGAALFDVVCVRQDRDCRACDRAATCLVPSWYDPGRLGGNAPRPFALRVLSEADPLGPDRPLVVQWALSGRVARPTAFVEAICRAAALGLGPDRVPHRVARLTVSGEGAPALVVADDAADGRWPEPAPLTRLVRLPRSVSGARVRVERLSGDRPPDGMALLDAAIGRVRGLARAQGVRLLRRWPDTRGVEGRWAGQVREGSRWSRRQQARVDLTGHSGVLEFGEEVAGFADLLAAAEVLQIGKNTSAGLGAITVDWEET